MSAEMSESSVDPKLSPSCPEKVSVYIHLQKIKTHLVCFCCHCWRSCIHSRSLKTRLMRNMLVCFFYWFVSSVGRDSNDALSFLMTLSVVLSGALFLPILGLLVRLLLQCGIFSGLANLLVLYAPELLQPPIPHTHHHRISLAILLSLLMQLTSIILVDFSTFFLSFSPSPWKTDFYYQISLLLGERRTLMWSWFCLTHPNESKLHACCNKSVSFLRHFHSVTIPEIDTISEIIFEVHILLSAKLVMCMVSYKFSINGTTHLGVWASPHIYIPNWQWHE